MTLPNNTQRKAVVVVQKLLGERSKVDFATVSRSKSSRLMKKFLQKAAFVGVYVRVSKIALAFKSVESEACLLIP